MFIRDCTPAETQSLDPETCMDWIYPKNMEVRQYQLKIVTAALFKNTFCCLPTGTGKTFIAAVVMYNFYRWFPTGTVVFMAPTKPLVAQQVRACFDCCGLPQHQTAELTGTTWPCSFHMAPTVSTSAEHTIVPMQAATAPLVCSQHSQLPAPYSTLAAVAVAGQISQRERRRLWATKRVIYCTPQVMQNDLRDGVCNAEHIVCTVIDEAHKAQGNFVRHGTATATASAFPPNR